MAITRFDRTIFTLKMLMAIFIVTQMIPFCHYYSNAPLNSNAGAISTWATDSDTDFEKGTIANLDINGSGSEANLTLKLDKWWEKRVPDTEPGYQKYGMMAPIYQTDKVIMSTGSVSCWEYDFNENKWTTRSTPQSDGAPIANNGAFSMLYGYDKIIDFGGGDSSVSNNNMVEYDYSSDKWSKIWVTPKPMSRYDHAMATLYNTDKVLLHGGKHVQDLLTRYNLNDTWIYDYSSNKWTEMKPIKGTIKKSGHAMAAIWGTDKVLMFGGEYLGFTDDITYIYDYSDNNWTIAYPNTTPPERYHHGMATIYGTDKVLLYGGVDENFDSRNDTWIYDYSDNNWTKIVPEINPGLQYSFMIAPVFGYKNTVLFGDNTVGNRTWIFSYIYTGTYESEIRTINTNSYLRTLFWDSEVPLNTSLKFQIRSANNNTNLQNAEYVGPDGKTSSFYNYSGQAVWQGHSGDAKFQYKIYFDTTDLNYTPRLDYVNFTYNILPKTTLSSPGNRAGIATDQPLFKWNFTDADSDQAAFQILIDQFADFSDPDYDSGIQTSSARQWQFPENTGYSNLPEGVWYWKMRAKDTDGNWTGYTDFWKFYVDITIDKPTNLKAEPASWTNKNSFKLSWTNPLEISGIAGAYYKLDSIPASNNDGTYSAGLDINSIDGIQVGGDGAHTLYLWLVDNAGNIDHNKSAAATLFYDSSPPANPLGVNVTPGSWTSKNRFEVNWTYPDDLSGVRDGAYYYIGSPPSDNLANWTWTDNKPFTITDAPEGETLLNILLKDNSGNLDIDNYSQAVLKLDTGTPVDVSVAINDDSKFTRFNKVNLKLAGEDKVSGIDKMSFSLDGGAWTPWENFAVVKEIEFSDGDGERQIHFKIKDLAGNTAIANDLIILDKTPPEIHSFDINRGAEWSKSNTVQLQMEITDELTGDLSASFSEDNDEWTGWEPYSSEREFVLSSGDGIKLVDLRVEDEAGNIAYSTDSINLDTKPPHSLSMLINGGDKKTNSTSVDLELDAVDDTAGLDLMAFSEDGEKWSSWERFSSSRTFILTTGDGLKTVYFRVQDMAGNTAGPVSEEITLDTTVLLEDTDGDGHPNINDAFPSEPTQWADSDGDGYGDNPEGVNADAFPDEGSQWSDVDGDGFGDNPDGKRPDAFPNNSSEWLDSDGDGVGDNTDAYPLDPNRWELEVEDPIKIEDPDDKEESSKAGIYGLIIAMVIVIIIGLFLFLKPEFIKGFTKKEPGEHVGEERNRKQKEIKTVAVKRKIRNK